MDSNTLLFQDKGSGGFKDVRIYPNRIEVLKKGTFGGKHIEIVYLKDIDVYKRQVLTLSASPGSASST